MTDEEFRREVQDLIQRVMKAQTKDFLELARIADLNPAEDFAGCDLSAAQLRDATLSGADLSAAQLRNATLSGANLSNAELRGADLSGANLSAADLSAAELKGANLSDTDLSNTILRATNLSDVNLKGANLSSADRRSRGKGAGSRGNVSFPLATKRSGVRVSSLALLRRLDWGGVQALSQSVPCPLLPFG